MSIGVTCRVQSGSNTWSRHGEGKCNDSPHETCEKELNPKVPNEETCITVLCYIVYLFVWMEMTLMDGLALLHIRCYSK